MQLQVDLTMFYKSGAVPIDRRRKRARECPTQPSRNAVATDEADGAETSAKRRLRCGECGAVGHNSRTCDA
eukprot:2399248-Pleurochrysis_carterae.AAC.1